MDGLIAAAKKEGALNVIALPPNWANYGEIIKGFEAKYGIKITSDQPDASSAEEISTAQRLKGQSKAPDVFDLGASVAMANLAMFAPYQVATWKDIPDNAKDPKGVWVYDYAGYMSIGYDSAKVPAPTSLADLLKPEYKGLIGYLDPASAFVGYVGAVAINQARGGSMDNFGPAIDYFKALKKNDPIVPKQTSYARVLSGEIAILLDYDFNAYRAKYKDKANVEFVIPAEGSVVVPYVMSLVNKGPNAANGQKALEFILSDEGQAIWANAYLRPVRASAISKEAQSRFLPASEYARAKPVDYAKMATVQKAFSDRYLKDVQ